MANLTDEQFSELVRILTGGKLFSELDEQTTLTTDDYFASINTGQSDAKKIKIPLLRGFLDGWDASTNTPTLANGVGLKGSVYRVDVAGNLNLGNGLNSYFVDDLIYYNGQKWINLIQRKSISTQNIAEANVSGSYTFDISGDIGLFYITMTADTSFTFPTLQIGESINYKVLLQGDFVPTFTNATISSPSVIYDGTKMNEIDVRLLRSSNDEQENRLFVKTNLT